MNDGSEGGNLRRGRRNGDDLMAGWRNKGKMRMEVGSDFTGSAGCFPERWLINFTFVSGLLAVHAEAHSHYIDTKQTGQQDVLRLKALQVVAKLAGPGAGGHGAGGAGKPRGEELLGRRSVTRGGLWVFALHTEKKLGYSHTQRGN